MLVRTLSRLMWVWGLADSIWLALAPSDWARFWGRFLDSLRRKPGWARGLAVLEFALSAYMLRRSFRE